MSPVALLRGLSEKLESLDTLLMGGSFLVAVRGSAGEDHLTRFLEAASGARLLVRLMPFLASAARLRRLSGLMFSAHQTSVRDASVSSQLKSS